MIQCCLKKKTKKYIASAIDETATKNSQRANRFMVFIAPWEHSANYPSMNSLYSILVSLCILDNHVLYLLVL